MHARTKALYVEAEQMLVRSCWSRKLLTIIILEFALEIQMLRPRGSVQGDRLCLSVSHRSHRDHPEDCFQQLNSSQQR